MKIRTGLGTILIAAVIVATNGAGARQAEPAPDLAADASNAFAWDLFAQLDQDDQNLFVSPASIAVALAMTWAGAEGRTAAEMAGVLHLADDPEAVHASFASLQNLLNEPDPAYTLRVANRLWGQQGYGFLDSFRQLTSRHYGAGLEQLDFVGSSEQSRRIINEWVAQETEQKILDLLPPGSINPATALVLTNAVSFLADWAHPFPAAATAPEEFHLTGGATIRVPTMKADHDLLYAEDDAWQVLTLPYEGGELEFVVLLPRDDGQTSSGPLSDGALRALLNSRRERQVTCWLPSFKLETSYSLVDPLKELGMTTAFDVALADFRGMTGRRDLVVSEVVHKAFIEIDEQGTEAAAATGVIMLRVTAAPPRPVRFHADHPFVFLIRHVESGAILFLGRCADPRGA